MFHDRLEFYLKPCFHEIAAIAKIEIKSAIVVLKKFLYYLEDGSLDAENQLAYKSPAKKKASAFVNLPFYLMYVKHLDSFSLGNENHWKRIWFH